MIDVIGFWMALTVLVAPVLFWISTVLEVGYTAYIENLTDGRYTRKNVLGSFVSKVWSGWYGEGLDILFTVGNFIYGFGWVVCLIGSITAPRHGTFLELHIKLAGHMTWLFWPVIIGVVLFCIHKLLKRIVSFGYTVSDKLEEK